MPKAFVLSFLLTFLVACNTTSVLGTNLSVAHQALGPKGYSIDPTFGYRISTPGIYSFDASGQPHQICAIDMRDQPALKNMPVAIEQFDDALEDNLAATNFRVTVPGVGIITSPYKKIKVDGYTIKTATAPDSGDDAEYILRNLGPNCPRVLARNLPYLVVTKVATAKVAYSLSKGAFDGAVGIGPATIGWSNPEIRTSARRNVTFALEGRLVSIQEAK